MFFHITRDERTGFKEVIDAGCQDLRSIDLPSGQRLVLLGDPLFRDELTDLDTLVGADGRMDLDQLFMQVPGHYYWFLWNGDALECGSSFGGLLPIYHVDGKDGVGIASSSFHLARVHGLQANDRQYLLERKLFNYPLFHRTPWSAVQLLPAHTSLLVDSNGLRMMRSFRVERYFGDGARTDRNAMHSLCGLFLDECDLHIPVSGCAISFTGGFDGRTLLGAALELKRSDIVTYSFGKPGDEDLEFPRAQSRLLGLEHIPIELDATYLKEHAFRSALAFMETSDHCGNLGRPHYLYAAESLARSHGHLVTGNFGSELFRAMHNPGVMISPWLIRCFSDTEGTWKEDLRRSEGELFKEEVGSLIADLEEYLNGPLRADPSGRFYRFVYEEVFRKYFGPELVVQSRYLKNRTPFLSLRFIETLNGTRWSGVHSRLFERNKFKRLKGQAFYAEFLRGTDPRLYALPTNKGYGPADVAEPWRRPLLAWKMLRMRYSGSNEVDSNAVGAFYSMYYRDLLAEYSIVDREELRPGLDKDISECIGLMSVEAAWNKARAVNSGMVS